MITLTGFGGVGEIGGNAFLLEAPGLRVMLDVGKRFGAAETMQDLGDRRGFTPEVFARRPGWGDYFDSFQKPRPQMAASDMGALDLIPWQGKLPRMYRPDVGGLPGESPVDFAMVSHPHVDHCGLVGLLRRDLPVVTSPLSLATLRSIQDTSTGGWETDYARLRVRGGLQRNAKGDLADADSTPVDRPFITDGKIPTAGKWEVQFFAVDHSIQGAGAFILSDGDTKIVYTGDFRRHGSNPERTQAFLKAAHNPDVLIMEGTNVSQRHHRSNDKERDVEEQTRRFIEEHQAAGGHPFVGIGYPPRDLDRLRSLHRVARAVGRRLLVSPKQAHLLSALGEAGGAPDWRNDPNLGVLVRCGNSGILRRPGHAPILDAQGVAVEFIQVSPQEWGELASKELSGWEFKMLGGQEQERKNGKGKRLITKPVPFGDEHIVTPIDVANDPGEYLVSLSLFNMTDLFDIFPDRAKAGGLYIHSLTQPHNDDMEMDQFRLQRWLRAFNLNAPTHEPKRTHVSGHISQDDVQEILQDLQPKVLVPVHSERPDLTKDRYERLCAERGLKHRALLPRWGHAEVLG